MTPEYPASLPTIKGSSIKALLEGNEVSRRLDLLTILEQRFGLNYHNLPATYPFDRYLELLAWLRSELYPNEAPEIGYEQLGRHIVQNFFKGAVGSLLRVTAEILGVQRGLNLFFQTMGNALPFGTFATIKTTKGYVMFMLWNVPGPPDVTRGMALETMEVAKAKKAVITYRKVSEKDTEFEARWEE